MSLCCRGSLEEGVYIVPDRLEILRFQLGRSGSNYSRSDAYSSSGVEKGGVREYAGLATDPGPRMGILWAR